MGSKDLRVFLSPRKIEAKKSSFGHQGVEDRNETLPGILLAVCVRPGVSTFRFGMVGQIEDIHFTLPDRLASPYLINGNSGNMAPLCRRLWFRSLIRNLDRDVPVSPFHP